MWNVFSAARWLFWPTKILPLVLAKGYIQHVFRAVFWPRFGPAVTEADLPVGFMRWNPVSRGERGRWPWRLVGVPWTKASCWRKGVDLWSLLYLYTKLYFRSFPLDDKSLSLVSGAEGWRLPSWLCFQTAPTFTPWVSWLQVRSLLTFRTCGARWLKMWLGPFWWKVFHGFCHGFLCFPNSLNPPLDLIDFQDVMSAAARARYKYDNFRVLRVMRRTICPWICWGLQVYQESSV